MSSPSAAKSEELLRLLLEQGKDNALLLLDAGGNIVALLAGAYPGPTGVVRAREWAPDVVRCDSGLPDLDGYGVVRKLRRDTA